MKQFRGKPDRTYWICYRVRGKLKWHRVGRASEGVTEEYANRKRLELLNLAHLGEQPTLRKTKVTTFDEVFTVYIEACRVDGRHVVAEENRYRKHIKPHFGDAGLDEFTDQALVKFKGMLVGRNLQPATVKKILGLMRSAINYGLRTRMFQGVNPLSRQAGFVMPREDNKGERWLTPMEVEALFKELEMRSPMVRDMAELSLRLGLRSTEIFRLKGKDVDAGAMTLYVTAKGGKRMPVRVHDQALIDLLLAYGRQPGEYIFQKGDGGRLIQIPGVFDRVVTKLGLNDGIEDKCHRVWFHVFRHTWASWLAQSGKVSLFELMQLGRWTRIETVMRYAHLMPDANRDKLRLIDHRLAEARQDHRPSAPDARSARSRYVRVRTTRASGSA